MIKAAIIDDDIITISILSKLIEQSEDVELIGSYNDPLEGLKALNVSQPDLLFVDIEMPEMSGLELIKALTFKSNFIFISAHASYAVEGFNLEAIDFLLKPIELDRFETSLKKAKANISSGIKNEEGVGFMFLKQQNQHDKVNFEDILFVKSDMDYLHIYTQEKRYVILHTLKTMLDKLAKFGFMKVHKSYIVNQEKINGVDIENHCLKIGEFDIPYSRRMKKEIFEKLSLS